MAESLPRVFYPATICSEDLIRRLMERIAWHSSMEFEREVLCEKSAVKKKLVFSSTTIAGRKRPFSLYNSRWCRRLG